MGYVKKWYPPMKASYQMIDNEDWICPVCKKMFKEGDVIGLQPVQVVKKGEKHGAVETIPVHRHCYLQEEKEE